MENPFYIEVGRPVYFFIGWCKDVNEKYENKDVTISLSGSYNSISTEYCFEEEIRLSEFINKLHYVVRGELGTTMEHIKRRLVVQNDSHAPIQISLENIAKALETFVKQREEDTGSVSSEASEDVELIDNAEYPLTSDEWSVSYTYIDCNCKHHA